MAIVLFVMVAAVILTAVVTYRRGAVAGGPEEGIKRTYATGLLIMLAFLLLAFAVARFGEGV